ncbi:MAG: DNA helicase RecQ [Pseudomonadota bacterium]
MQHADKHTVLKNVFGYDAFRPGQEEIIDTLLGGTSVLAVMPTGAGKSLCFQVPALAMDGLSIVVSPLVALMQDQVSALKLAGVAAGAIHSNQDRDANVDVWREAASGRLRILYMAPERLMTERMLGAVEKLPLRLFAIDEAHCMSQWGPSFRPEYAALGALSERFPNTPIAAMTATADETTRKDIERQLFVGPRKVFVSGFDRPNIKLSVAPKNRWKDQLIDFVSAHTRQSGIVYCLSRKKTEEVAELLTQNGINATAYHAGLDRAEREARQQRFVMEDDLVMAATIAFGMGIDKPDVRFVFHTDLPGSVEAYYQEIGRAGRDGDPADAMMVYGQGDIRMRRQFIEDEQTDDEHQQREVARLNALVSYAEAQTCRRQTLLSYFGDQSEPCGNCDNCLNPFTMQDGREVAELVIGAIIETGERFGQAHIVDVLRGAVTEKIEKAKHDQLESHGAGASRPKPEWQAIIRQMIAAGLLEVDVGGYSSLLITAKGNAFSRGQGTFEYRADLAERTSKRRQSRDALGAATSKSAPLVATDEKLFSALKRERLTIAKERDVPAYVIFPDKTLLEMAREKPRTMKQFAGVKGVGRAKLAEFGEQFLDVIRNAA